MNRHLFLLIFAFICFTVNAQPIKDLDAFKMKVKQVELERQANKLNLQLNGVPENTTYSGQTSKNVIFSEDFENATGYNLPPNWTEISANPNDNWYGVNTNNFNIGVDAHSGERCAFINFGESGDLDAWLFSPAINLTAGKTYTVNFWIVLFGLDMWGLLEYEHFEVYIGQDLTASAMMAGEQLYYSVDERFIEWRLVSKEFTPTQTGTYYIGFHAFTPFYEGMGIVLDDVEVLCEPEPIEVVSYTPTGTNVELETEITVKFNQKITAEDLSLITVVPELDGLTPNVTDSILTVTHNGFAYNTLYTVNIPTGTIAGYNEVITWSFTTRGEPIEILSLEPEDGVENVWFDAVVAVTFNQNITANDLSEIIITSDIAHWEPVVTPVIIDNKLVLEHDEFDMLVWYTVIIPANAINGYEKEIKWSFMTTEVGIKSSTSKEITIYPNPVKNDLYFNHYYEKIELLEITDLTGRTIINKTDFTGQSIDVSEITQGVYFLKLTNKEQITINKFVKE